MKLTRVIAGLALGAAVALYACVGDDSTKPPDGGTDATTDVATQDGGSCDGAMCSGVCVETSSDSKNCGRCAHTCGTAQCSAGACLPVLIDGTEDAGVEAGVISSLTTDQGDDNPAGQALHIFWAMTGNNGVFQDNATGGNVVKLSTQPTSSLTNVSVNGSTAYWFIVNTVGVQQPVFKGQVNTAGSQSAAGTINGSAIQSILIDPTSQNVFGSYTVSTMVGAFKCVTGTCTMIMSQAGQAAGNVATDGTHLYFCDVGNGVIMQVTFTGNSAPFISSQASPALLRVNGQNPIGSTAARRRSRAAR